MPYYDWSKWKQTQAKLNVKKVAEIRQKYNDGITQKQLAIDYKVTISCISRIVNGYSWKGVK